MTRENEKEPVKVFCSYAREDEPLRQKLATHLQALVQQGLIEVWDRSYIGSGEHVEEKIDHALKSAQIIVLLISPDYLTPGDYHSVEWDQAMDRHELDKTWVIPVILRSCVWEQLPFSKLQVLPTNKTAVTLWSDVDEALSAVTRGVKEVAEELLAHDVTSAGQVHDSVRRVEKSLSDVLWNVPALQNRIFTGRDEIIAKVADFLKTGQVAALSQRLAISGLGGIGKTQVALEYAYRYWQQYQVVFWVRADTLETLMTDYSTIAERVQLPQSKQQDQRIVLRAVQTWLKEHSGWLLILDNADNLDIIHDFLPTPSQGHIILTTRAQVLGNLAHGIEVEEMDQDNGALFLLRRAKFLKEDDILAAASPADVVIARQISKDLGGLPLALDQAGAYIEETQCGLAGYQQRYHLHRSHLLLHRGEQVTDHPEPVATTWSLNFEQVERKMPAAADLLRLCAFLHPDAIPETILKQGINDSAPENSVEDHYPHARRWTLSWPVWLGRNVLSPIRVQSADHSDNKIHSIATDPMLLDKAIKILRSYSLIRRNASDQSLTVHRLVQAVLKDAMDAQEQRKWAKQAVMAVDAAFPGENVEVWRQSEIYVPHAQICAELVEQKCFTFSEAFSLLLHVGSYLIKRAQYAEAEPLLQQALTIQIQTLGRDSSDTAYSLNALGELYYSQDRYAEAEPLFQQALAIHERVSGSTDIASSLNNLGLLYSSQGKYEQAELLFQQSLSIKRQREKHNDPATAITLGNLAALCMKQGKYEQAESLFQLDLSICEQALEPRHHNIAACLNNLGFFYSNQGKYEQAEHLLQRALSICEQALGDHPYTVGTFINLANLYTYQSKYGQAEPLYQRAFAINKRLFGLEHPQVESTLIALALLHHYQGEDKQAIEDYTALIKLAPKNALYYVSRGNAYYSLKQYEQAIEDYTEAIKYAPENAVYYSTLGNAYYDLKQYLQAIGNYTESIKRAPENATYYDNRGNAYLDLHQYEDALKDFSQAIKLAPKEAGYYINRAAVYRYMEEYDKALADHDCALQEDENNEISYVSKAITYLWRRDSFDLYRAQDELQKGCKRNLQHLYAAWFLVWCQFCQQSATSDSEDLAEQLIAIAARDKGENKAVASICRGVAYWIRRQFVEAQAECNAAIDAEPDHWHGYFWKGVVDASQDKKEEAQQAIEKALARKIPPLLLKPLHRLKQDTPVFYQMYALPLLTQLEVLEE